MKRLLRCFLSIFTLSAGSSMALAEDTVDIAVTPPALVQCQSEKNCDRNPKHLEQFVIDFYKWYINDQKMFFALAKKSYLNMESDKQFMNSRFMKNKCLQEAFLLHSASGGIKHYAWNRGMPQ